MPILTPLPQATTVSAPGKVLLAGGYLVLDRQYTGLVVATSSRFYAHATSLSSSPPSTPAPSSSRLVVQAGQFPRKSSTWSYTVSLDASTSAGGLRVAPEESQSGKNKFVEITVQQALRVASEILCGVGQGEGIKGDGAEEVLRRMGEGVRVVVLADNDFYSQREQLKQANLPATLSSLPLLTPFHPLPLPISQTNKTGLGSSAALVTSLTASLLVHLGVVSLLTPSESESLHSLAPAPAPSPSHAPATYGVDLVHSLAQFSHCLAQGKIGSGFDVSSATYGTHIYRRFSPSILSPLLSPSSSPDRLLPTLDPTKWDHTQTPFRLPRGLRLLLADVDAGTDTPSFVSKVLSWRRENALASEKVWGLLDKANRTLEVVLAEMVKLEGSREWEVALEEASMGPIDEADTSNPASKLLLHAQLALSAIRALLRELSALSDVPIEPPEQTRLLDACALCPGVIGGGVPGAGGYDALFLLVVDRPEVLGAVEHLWQGWREMSVCPLLAAQSDGGLRVEDPKAVKGLEDALRRCE